MRMNSRSHSQKRKIASITEVPVCTKFPVIRKRRTTISVGAVKENKNRIMSQNITGVQNSSCHQSGLAGRMIHFSINGETTQVYAANINRTSANHKLTRGVECGHLQSPREPCYIVLTGRPYIW